MESASQPGPRLPRQQESMSSMGYFRREAQPSKVFLGSTPLLSSLLSFLSCWSPISLPESPPTSSSLGGLQGARHCVSSCACPNQHCRAVGLSWSCQVLAFSMSLCSTVSTLILLISPKPDHLWFFWGGVPPWLLTTDSQFPKSDPHFLFMPV